MEYFTTDNIKGATRDKWEDIHWFWTRQSTHLFGQNLCFVIKNIHKRGQDGEVERWRQQFSSGLPLFAFTKN